MWRWLKRPRRDDEAPPFCSAGDSQGKAGVAVTAAPPPADAPAATFDLASDPFARDPFSRKSDSLRLYTDFEKLLSTGAPQPRARARPDGGCCGGGGGGGAGGGAGGGGGGGGGSGGDGGGGRGGCCGGGGASNTGGSGDRKPGSGKKKPCCQSPSQLDREGGQDGKKKCPCKSLKVCKRRREHSLFPRFVLTVLEALRDLAQDQPLCGAYSLDTITRRVTEHFIVDGDADAQVRTALRVAHVSGLVVYYEEEQAYLLASSSFEDMQVAEWRYERYLRRRRELSSIDAARMLRKGGLKCPDTQVAKEDCACQYCGPCDPCGGPEKTSPPPPPPPPPSTGC